MSYGEMEQQYTAALQKLIELQKKYGLDSTETLKAQKQLAEFQVVTPLLGEFSTGKSSLINAMLGNKILGENITPETAVPTEICYGEQEKAIIYSKDNEPSKELTLEEYKQCSFSASETHKVRLYLNHPFLKEIETVRIVDMPGFNSGIELHNRAIDEYLPEAEAYLLTFDARTPTISEDMANFIKELKLHEVPVYFLITKSRAVTEDECRICTDRIRQDAEKYLGLPQVSIGVTNAKGKIKILEPFQADLREIEKKSQDIFRKVGQQQLDKCAFDLQLYLDTSIRQAALSPSELEGKIEEVQQNMDRIQTKMEKERLHFENQIGPCLDTIRIRLDRALRADAPELEDILLRQGDIKNRVILLVREVITKAFKEVFASKISAYLGQTFHTLQMSIPENINLELMPEQLQLDRMVENTTREVIKMALPAILGVLGVAISGIIGGIIVGIISILVALGFNKKREQEKRQMARRKIESELIPTIINVTMEKVQSVIADKVQEINVTIQRNVQLQMDAQKKALADLKKDQAAEMEEKQARLTEWQQDLEQVKKLQKA